MMNEWYEGEKTRDQNGRVYGFLDAKRGTIVRLLTVPLGETVRWMPYPKRERRAERREVARIRSQRVRAGKRAAKARAGAA